MNELITYTLVTATVPRGYDIGALRSMLGKAAGEWNKVFKGTATLFEVKNSGDILIKFGAINRAAFPDRIAECRDLPGKRWEVVFAIDRKWQVSRFSRLFGIGESFLCAATHEFGHVFDLPHSADERDVMAPSCDRWKISDEETVMYREQFQSVIRQPI